MEARVKLIKKKDRNAPPPVVEAEESSDPKEWSSAVKSWVKEFKADRREGALEALDGLVSDSKP